MGRLIEARETRGEDTDEAIKNLTDAELKGVGGALYSAGADTTYSSETTFVMAMLLTPNVQRKAQQEVDAVTGGARLPNFEDWNSIPIVERIVYEVLRWAEILQVLVLSLTICRFHPPAPNGCPPCPYYTYTSDKSH